MTALHAIVILSPAISTDFRGDPYLCKGRFAVAILTIDDRVLRRVACVHAGCALLLRPPLAACLRVAGNLERRQVRRQTNPRLEGVQSY